MVIASDFLVVSVMIRSERDEYQGVVEDVKS